MYGQGQSDDLPARRLEQRRGQRRIDATRHPKDRRSDPGLPAIVLQLTDQVILHPLQRGRGKKQAVLHLFGEFAREPRR